MTSMHKSLLTQSFLIQPLLTRSFLTRGIPAGLTLAALLLPPAAWAADPSAGTKPTDTRLVRFTQVVQDDVEAPPPSEVSCPDVGCQLAVTLRIGSRDYGYQAIVSFVTLGSYVTLEPAPGTTRQIRDFTQPRPGPIFVQRGSNGQTARMLRLVLDTATLESNVADQVRVASAPDVYLRVEIAPAKPPQG